MIIDKVYNNNVVQVKTESGEEMIVMGRGLGFQKRKGDNINQTLIEKTFVLDKVSTAKQMSRVYSDLSSQEIDIIIQIVLHAEEVLETKFDISLYISLADHLHFAIERCLDGITIPNPLCWEVKKFFPNEFQVAKDSLTLLKKELDVVLPNDEIASIALHFINAQKDAKIYKKRFEISKIVSGIMDIVKTQCSIEEVEDDIYYNRFLSHVQYFAQRVMSGIVQGKNDSFLYEQILMNYPKAFSISEKIKYYIKNTYSFEMSKDEQVYLTIHIQKLFQKI